MVMKKFYVGAKAVVQDPSKGVFLVKHTSGFWDMPGGRLDDNESLEEGMLRELKEEVPDCKINSIGEQIGAYRIHRDIVDDISLVLVFFKVDVEMPDDTKLSEEHTEFKWVKSADEAPDGTHDEMKKIIQKVLG